MPAAAGENRNFLKEEKKNKIHPSQLNTPTSISESHTLSDSHYFQSKRSLLQLETAAGQGSREGVPYSLLYFLCHLLVLASSSECKRKEEIKQQQSKPRMEKQQFLRSVSVLQFSLLKSRMIFTAVLGGLAGQHLKI